MFTDFYAQNTVAAHELRASDRVLIWGDTYTIDYYSVTAHGSSVLWVSPERDAEGNLPHNPLKTMTVHRDFKIEIAPK